MPLLNFNTEFLCGLNVIYIIFQGQFNLFKFDYLLKGAITSAYNYVDRVVHNCKKKQINKGVQR